MSALAPTSKYPTFKFSTPGTKIKGTVSQPPRDFQARVFGSTELAFWPDGNPKMQTQVVVRAEDGTEWAIYVKDRMAKAVREAVAAANAKDVEPGGVLEVEFTELGVGKGAMPPKLYKASYTAPAEGVAVADDDEPPF